MTRSRTILPAVLAALLVSMASACNEEPFELRYETEHLRIGVADDRTLCGGDLAQLERQVTNVEDLLSTEIEGKVDVYLWRYPSKGVDEYCTEETGCYRRETNTIYSNESSIGHELVHAVAIPLGKPSAMWSEGIAEALNTRRTFPGSTPPSENFFRDNDDVDYGSAGHFVRWVWETHGPQAVRDLLTDTREPELAFEAITGQTLDAAEADYYAQAPWVYGLLVSCQDPALEQVEAARWTATVDLDCANDETLSGIDNLGVRRTFEVTTRGDFEFVSDASQLFIQRCPDEDLLARPTLDDREQGDVPASTPGVPEGPTHVIDFEDGGQVLDLDPGRYELILAAPETAPGTATVSLEVTRLE